LLLISPVHLEHPDPSTARSFSVPCSLFSFAFVLRGGDQYVQGAILVDRRVAVGILHDAYLLTCWSAFPKQFGVNIWQPRSPPVFSVKCGVEKLFMGWWFRVSEF
jgi:hypothetical protein